MRRGRIVISQFAQRYVCSSEATEIAKRSFDRDENCLDDLEENQVLEHHCVVESNTGPREVIASVTVLDGIPYCHINMAEEYDYVEAVG